MAYRYKGRELRPSMELYHDAIPYLGGITMREFFLEPEKCAQAWREATARLEAYFGGLFPLRRHPAPPPLSYGHLVCLGAPVRFPVDGEPNVSPFVGSIDEAIAVMEDRQGMDFTQNQLFSYYLDVWRCMRGAFPDIDMPFSGFGSQGPITTAVLMRGQDFLLDLYDEPEKAKRFVMMIVDSAAEFIKTARRINGTPEIQPSGGMADDFASLIPPSLWPEFVLPALNRHYEFLTAENGRRSLHLENLTPAHLPMLRELRLKHFQPSVSTALTLENVKESLDPGIEFDWLLYAYEVTALSDAAIQDWVDKAAEAGVLSIRTQYGAYACQAGKLDRIAAFFHAFDKYKA